MASLASKPGANRRWLMPQAIGLYAKALKRTNLALQDLTVQKQDSTVASVLLLGFFESITSETSNILAWGSHIDGAVQLIKLRGKKQLRTKTGHALFVAVRTQMVIMCMSASRTPISGVDWWIVENPTDHSVFIIKLLFRVAELRAKINHCLGFFPRTPEYSQEVLNLMQQAQSMEFESQDWAQSLPKMWQVRAAAWVDNIPGGDITKADVCPGRVDNYTDIYIATMWNNLRISRLFLAGLIVRCAAWICSPVDYRTTPEYATSARTGVDMVTDIIASVPYSLGWRGNEEGQVEEGDLWGFTSGNDEMTSTKALGGFFLIWPLFCAVCSDYTTDSQRQWIKGRMCLIGDVLGLHQAKTISSFQIRLPSMTIRRDNIGVAHPAMSDIAPNAVKTSDIRDPLKKPLCIPFKTERSAIDAEPKMTSPPPDSDLVHLVDPMRHQMASHEAFEKEKKLLLSKASNFGGESVEKGISNYLAI